MSEGSRRAGRSPGKVILTTPKLLALLILALSLTLSLGCGLQAREEEVVYHNASVLTIPGDAVPEEEETIGDRIERALFTQDKYSPFDHIKPEQIHVYEDKIVIDIKGAQWSEFADTNSMDPTIDVGANALQMVPQSPDDIYVGDIVSYESELVDGVIIHRVVEIGDDEEGKYFILKGDNNPFRDPGKVRFSQIRRVLVGIIY